MICLTCGKTIDDDVRVCPFCGSLTEGGESAPISRDKEARTPDAAPDEDTQSFYEDDPALVKRRRASRRAALAGNTPALILSALACVFSAACLLVLLNLRGQLLHQNEVVTARIDGLNTSVQAIDAQLDRLDTTVAGVQNEAYEQLASQTITITKDITPLTGPVDAGKYNRMFIVNVKGNLSVTSSFDWQRYNEATGGWVSVVFTGEASSNEQYGLRLENTYDKKEEVYSSILWANGIKTEASGTYRCVITDVNKISKTSAEATVAVQ